MSAQGGGGNIILVSLAKHTDLILNRSPDSAWFSEAGSPAVLLSSSHYILGWAWTALWKFFEKTFFEINITRRKDGVWLQHSHFLFKDQACPTQ